MSRFASPAVALVALIAMLLAACSSDGGSASVASGSTPLASVASVCETSAPLRLPASPSQPLVAIADALALQTIAPAPSSACDHDAYPGTPGLVAVVAAARGGDGGARVAAGEAIVDRVGELAAAPEACLPGPRFPCTTELGWLASQAGDLGSGTAVEAAEGGMGEAFRAESSGLDATSPMGDLLDGAATAQLLGLDGLADALLDPARTAAENEVLRRAGEIEPCSGSVEDVRSLMEAIAASQALGGDGAVHEAGLAAAAGALRAAGRRAMSGNGGAFSFEQLSVVAGHLGLGGEGWTEDEECLEEWELYGSYSGDLFMQGGSSLSMAYEATVRFTTTDGDAGFSASDAMTVTASATVPGCTIVYQIDPSDFRVTGSGSSYSGSFELEVEFGEVGIGATITCPKPVGTMTSPTHTSPPFGLTVTLDAEDGATYDEPWTAAGVGGGGRMLIRLTRIR